MHAHCAKHAPGSIFDSVFSERPSRDRRGEGCVCNCVHAVVHASAKFSRKYKFTSIHIQRDGTKQTYFTTLSGTCFWGILFLRFVPGCAGCMSWQRKAMDGDQRLFSLKTGRWALGRKTLPGNEPSDSEARLRHSRGGVCSQGAAKCFSDSHQDARVRDGSCPGLCGDGWWLGPVGRFFLTEPTPPAFRRRVAVVVRFCGWGSSGGVRAPRRGALCWLTFLVRRARVSAKGLGRPCACDRIWPELGKDRGVFCECAPLAPERSSIQHGVGLPNGSGAQARAGKTKLGPSASEFRVDILMNPVGPTQLRARSCRSLPGRVKEPTTPSRIGPLWADTFRARNAPPSCRREGGGRS